MTGPMNPENWTHKKRLNITEQPFNILPSVLTAPLNQIGIGREQSSSFGLPRILKEIWHHKQPQSGTKANIVRLMHDRWWFNCARFIKNIVNIWLRLRPTQMVKTVYVGTIGALTQHPGLVKSFRQ